MSNILVSMTGSRNFGDAVADILYKSLSKINIKVVSINNNNISYLTAGSVLRLSNENHIIMGI